MDTKANLWIIMNTLRETYEQLCNLWTLLDPYVEYMRQYLLFAKKVATIFLRSKLMISPVSLAGGNVPFVFLLTVRGSSSVPNGGSTNDLSFGGSFPVCSMLT